MTVKRDGGRRIIVVIIMFLAVAPVIRATQDNDEWPSLAYLKSDYGRVAVVAHVRVQQAEIVNRIGGYEDWHIVGEVIESFKGKFRKGETIDFYHGAEAGFRKELFLGEKIVFLQRNFVEKEKRWVLAVLENSTLPYTKDRVQKLRLIKRSTKRKRATHNREKTIQASRPKRVLPSELNSV